jgi:hypothetical protein
MNRDLPTPAQILEKLADRVAAQIDRQAPLAFDEALDEMTRYHRFLLRLNASRTPEGAAFSYAEVSGNAWTPPHREWVRQYSRLMARAADRIPDDDHFIKKLAQVALQLLPGPSDAELPASVVQVLLDLGPMMMHRVEAWVTKRTSIDTPAGEGATPRLAMAPSDSRAYADVLPDIVGGWEHLLQVSPTVFGWREVRQGTNQQKWVAHRASWPFLWQHLANTAYCLAVAVWNEDEQASTMFREALVRWPRALGHRLPDHGELRWRRLLYPEILNLDWDAASDMVEKLGYGHGPKAAPGEVFATLLHNSHRDVLLLTAALLLRWTIEGKQSSTIGARTAAELIRRECSPDDGVGVPAEPTTFRGMALDLVRMELAGSGYRDGSYAARLDGLVASLDNMTERRVVPGRVYTPSTSHGRGDVKLAMTAMLIAAASRGADESIAKTVGELAADEDILPAGDQSCRDLVDTSQTYREALDRNWPQVSEGFRLLEPKETYQAAVQVLRQMLTDVEAAVERERLNRLRARPVDPAKLEAIRAKVEEEILKAVRITIFQEPIVTRGEYDAAARDHDTRFSGVPKARLVEPPMEVPSLNFEGVVASGVSEAAGTQAWRAFVGRPRQTVDVPDGPTTGAFWEKIAPLIAQLGAEPVLIVPRETELRALRLISRLGADERAGLRIEQKPRYTPGAVYIASINGVEVFGLQMPPGTSWLFSSCALRRITFSAVQPAPPPSPLVSIIYSLENDTTGALVCSLRQAEEWTDDPIFELNWPLPCDAPNTSEGGESDEEQPERSVTFRSTVRRTVATVLKRLKMLANRG